MTFSSRDESINEEVLEKVVAQWNFLLHPLRDKFRHECNEELVSKIAHMREQASFATGKIFLCCIDTPEGPWLFGLRKLVWDSEFFGFGIGKLELLISPSSVQLSASAITTATQGVKLLLNQARKNGLKQLSASIDCGDALFVQVLEDLGFRLKDTINYHLFDLARTKLDATSENVRMGTEGDGDALGQVALRCFGNRTHITNRFNSDLQFPMHLVGEMYRLWIVKSLSGELANSVIVGANDGYPCGYLTAILPTDKQRQLGLLLGDQGVGAIDPSSHRQGLFNQIHNATLTWLKENGATYALTRTALSTIGVNKVCARRGAVVALSAHTLHLNMNEPANGGM